MPRILIEPLRVAFLLLSLSSATALLAQSAAVTPQYTRHELAIGVSSDPVGPLLRYTFNVSSHFAVEAKLSGLPTVLLSGQDEMLASAGIKAGARRGRWGFFGTITPGWGVRPDDFLQYGSVEIPPLGTVIAPVVDRAILRSRFVLQEGAAAEYSVSPRTFVRLDFTAFLEPTFRQQQYNNFTVGIYSRGSVGQNAALDLTIGHRFGAFRGDTETLSPRRSSIDIGALYSLQLREHLLENDVLADSGYGAWAAYNVSPHISLEVAGFRSPHNDMTYNFQDGGQEAAAFAGVKLGPRHDHIGYFVKIRPGFERFSHSIGGIDLATVADFFNKYKPVYQPALDVGGVLEWYPTRHTIVRAEAGDAQIFYHSASVNELGYQGTAEGFTSPSILFLFGGGLRF